MPVNSPIHNGFLVAALLACAAPLMAQETFDGCDVASEAYATQVAPALTGTWEISNEDGAAWMYQGGTLVMSMPMEPEAETEMVIRLTDAGLRIDSEEFEDVPGTLRQGQGLEGPALEVSDQVIDPRLPDAVDFPAMDMAPACDATELPVLVIEGTVPVEDMPGARLNFEGLFYLLDANRMAGVMVFAGGAQGFSMEARRFASARRVE